MRPCWCTKTIVTTHGERYENSADALQPWLRGFSTRRSFQGEIRRKSLPFKWYLSIRGDPGEDDIDMWPAVTYVHVCMCLILYSNLYTRDEMFNYKSLDSFKNFPCGWVREVFVKEVNDKRVVIGRVS